MLPTSKISGDTLDRDSFRTIAALAYQECGLNLVPEKATMIQSRLRHRLRALGVQNFSQYCAHVQSPEGQNERRQLVSALTTNVSHFFREDHHFDRMVEFFRNRLQTRHNSTHHRIWSAGCSNGQEAISAAITILNNLPELVASDLRILATDIDSRVIRFARRAAYPKRLMSGMPSTITERFFRQGEVRQGELEYSVAPEIRSLIRYNELNLMAEWPMKSEFDIIFCRNVVIYFDIETQEALWPRFRRKLRPGGLLFLGHSERIVHPERFGFTCTGPTTYQVLPD